MVTEDQQLQVFESTVFKPGVERRANDSLMVILMQEVHRKIEDMDKRLTQHMTDETLLLAQEIAKLMNNAFPGSDPAGHRTFHEAQMQVIADRATFWKAMRIEISKWGLIGMLGFILVSVWRHLLEGPK